MNRYLRPHFLATSVTQINYEALYSLGLRYLIFDRDNTITSHLSTTYIDDRRDAVEHCKRVFGDSNVALLSNALIGVGGKQLGLNIIQTTTKKPFNADSVRKHFPLMDPNSELCIVGDRILTDCLLANLLGAVFILVPPV
jgi:phosphatidylglycerophosphatase GEP4